MLWPGRPGGLPVSSGVRGRTARTRPGVRRREAQQQGREAVEAFEQLKKLVAEAQDDIEKAEGGNKAAGTRARQAMQQIKEAAQEVRKQILELRDAGKPS